MFEDIWKPENEKTKIKIHCATCSKSKVVEGYCAGILCTTGEGISCALNRENPYNGWALKEI